MTGACVTGDMHGWGHVAGVCMTGCMLGWGHAWVGYTCVAKAAFMPGKVCMVEGCIVGVHGWGCAWMGVCMAGGVHGWGCALFEPCMVASTNQNLSG